MDKKINIFDFAIDGYHKVWKQYITNKFHSFIVCVGGRNSGKSKQVGYLNLLLRLEKEPLGNAYIFRKFSNIHNQSSRPSIEYWIRKLKVFFPNLSNWKFNSQMSRFERYHPTTKSWQYINFVGYDTGGVSKVKSTERDYGYNAMIIWDEAIDPDDRGKVFSDEEIQNSIDEFYSICYSIFRRDKEWKNYPKPQFIVITNNEHAKHWIQQEFYVRYFNPTIEEMENVGEWSRIIPKFKEFEDPDTKELVVQDALFIQSSATLLLNNDHLGVFDSVMKAGLFSLKETDYEKYKNVVLGFPPQIKRAKFIDTEKYIIPVEFDRKDLENLYPLDIGIDYGNKDEITFSFHCTNMRSEYDEYGTNYFPVFNKIYKLESKSLEGLIDSKGLINKNERRTESAKILTEWIHQLMIKYDVIFSRKEKVDIVFKPDFFHFASELSLALKEYGEKHDLGSNYFERKINMIESTENFMPKYHNPNIYEILYHHVYKKGRMYVNKNTDNSSYHFFSQLQYKDDLSKVIELKNGQDRIEGEYYSYLRYMNEFLNNWGIKYDSI